jgi:hypothetical protein
MQDNSLLRLHELKPGPFYRFVRFGRYGPDRMEHVPVLLSDRYLDALVRSGGAMILFVHLGKRSDPAGPVLTTPAADAFRSLARRFHEQRLFLQTTSRLLRYIAVRDHLQYSVTRDSGRTRLDVRVVDDPVLGTFVPTDDDLAGIAFVIDAADAPIVSVAGRPASHVQVEREGRRFAVQFPPRYPEFGDLLDE